ncbi:MAG: CoA-disulfide reductase [Caldithrix sp.]|nr:CoA-disulfide reductase [Caldithrix sp.]
MATKQKRIVIIGGVAAGMSAASRARRNDPNAEIIVYEKSNFVSYAACGLPYYISNDIKHSENLIAINADTFRTERNIAVYLNHEALSFDPRKRLILIKDSIQGKEITETYDRLIIATGAHAFKPDIPGINNNRVYCIKTLEESITVKNLIEHDNLQEAIIAGGGYIGLEMAEALHKRGIHVKLIEMNDHLMPNIDKDLSTHIEKHLIDQGCKIYTSSTIVSITHNGSRTTAQLGNGHEISADVVIWATGVRPNTQFATSGGVRLGTTGAIEVNSKMRTNVYNVFAAGDCAEVRNLVKNKPDYIPLGTTANKQGRVAGDNATGGVSHFRGVVGTAVVKVFDLEIARTGLTEAYLENLGLAYKSVNISGKSRAGYYPGAEDVHFKLLFSPVDGRIYGAQIIGREGAAKRIDTVALALHQKMTVQQLKDVDLSYAPPYAPVWEALLIATNKAIKKLY